MISEYSLHGHSWFRKMYGIRHKWTIAFSRALFLLILNHHKEVKSTNSVLGEIANKTTSLTNFLVAFQKLINGWCQIEAKKNFQNNQSMPSIVVTSNRILH